MNAHFNRSDPLRFWRRNATVQAVAHLQGKTVTETATRLYGHEGAEQVLKAAVNPAATDDWGSSLAAEQRVGAFLGSLRGASAAAELFERGKRFDLSGINSMSLPRSATDYPEPAWAGEGEPIPAQKGDLTGVTLGPPKKLAAIAGLTTELGDLSAEDAETIIEELMRDAAARALDASLFSDAAASAVRPAGLLNGVTPITATTGGGLNAFLGDVRALAGAIQTAGGGSSVVLVAATPQALTAKILGGANFDVPIINAPSLAAGTVIAIEARAFATGFSDAPRVDVGKEVTLHWDDAPTQLSTAGTTNEVAAPVRSAFQEANYALKLVLRAAWAMRAPGMVQTVTGATW